MADEPIKIENLRRIDVKPGDRFVLLTDRAVGPDEQKHIQEAWRAFMGGDDHKLLVLPSGWRIEALNPETVHPDNGEAV